MIDYCKYSPNSLKMVNALPGFTATLLLITIAIQVVFSLIVLN